MSNDPEILKISVHEDIHALDVPPGTPGESPMVVFMQKIKKYMGGSMPKDDAIPATEDGLNEEDEGLTPEERASKEQFMAEYLRLQGRYVEPHNIKSRWVEPVDIMKVMADAKDLLMMCKVPRGKYAGIAALAHSQIESKNPLRFFVFPNGLVVINPMIIFSTKVPVFKVEGCMSYPDKEMKNMVPRYSTVQVVYQTFKKEGESISLSEPKYEELTGNAAHVFQHECAHLNGHNLYDDNAKPEDALFLGDGPMIDESVKKLYNPKVEPPKDETK